MPDNHNTYGAYGDGRFWDAAHIATTHDIINNLYDDLDRNELGQLRKDTLWLMDVLFPTGFTYAVNRGPSEEVHGGYMHGEAGL